MRIHRRRRATRRSNVLQLDNEDHSCSPLEIGKSSRSAVDRVTVLSRSPLRSLPTVSVPSHPRSKNCPRNILHTTFMSQHHFMHLNFCTPQSTLLIGDPSAGQPRRICKSSTVESGPFTLYPPIKTQTCHVRTDLAC